MEKQKRKHRVIKQTEIDVVLLQQKEKKKKRIYDGSNLN